MILEHLKSALLDVLGRRPTLAQRREAIQALEELAEEQRRIITVLQEQARRPPDQRLTARLHSPQAGPGAPPGRGIRWNGRQLHVGRELWYALGGVPAMVSFSFDGPYTVIHPERTGHGGEYKVINIPGQIPRIACRRACEIGEWEEGLRPGEVVGGSIRFYRDATEV